MKISVIRIYILLIWFAWAYFWGFKWLGQLITKYYFPGEHNEINIWSKIFIYTGCVLITILLMLPFIKKGINSFKKEYLNEIITGLTLIFLILIPLVAFKVFLGNSMEVESSIVNKNGKEIVVLLFSSLIYAPVVEELICRAGIFYVLTIRFNVNSKLVVIISAIIFSIMHLVKMKNNFLVQIYWFTIYFLLGMICGYIYKKTDNILCAIIMHLLWNVYTLTGSIVKSII